MFYGSNYIPWRIHGAGRKMLTWLGCIDGIHGTPYIAAPWIRHGYVDGFVCWTTVFMIKSPLKHYWITLNLLKSPFFGECRSKWQRRSSNDLQGLPARLLAMEVTKCHVQQTWHRIQWNLQFQLPIAIFWVKSEIWKITMFSTINGDWIILMPLNHHKITIKIIKSIIKTQKCTIFWCLNPLNHHSTVARPRPRRVRASAAAARPKPWARSAAGGSVALWMLGPPRGDDGDFTWFHHQKMVDFWHFDGGFDFMILWWF